MAFKRKRDNSNQQSSTQRVLSEPHWSYLRLSTLPPAPGVSSQPLDALTVRLALLQALSTYLGDHGAAIPIDILQIEHEPRYSDVIVRIPHDDRDAFAAAVSSASSTSRVALRIKTSADWLSGLIPGPVDDIFDFKPDSHAA